MPDMPDNGQAVDRLIGFDFGEKRIGVATGQRLTGTASALTTLQAVQGKPDWPAISRLILDWQPDALVVGIPYHMDGRQQAMTEAAERFCRQLEGRFQLSVFRAEERLSSVEAEMRLGKQGKQATDTLDAVAAEIILESWLQQKADTT